VARYPRLQLWTQPVPLPRRLPAEIEAALCNHTESRLSNPDVTPR
jgi:hypothetical protein